MAKKKSGKVAKKREPATTVMRMEMQSCTMRFLGAGSIGTVDVTCAPAGGGKKNVTVTATGVSGGVAGSPTATLTVNGVTGSPMSMLLDPFVTGKYTATFLLQDPGTYLATVCVNWVITQTGCKDSVPTNCP